MTRLLPKGLSSLLPIPAVAWIQPRQFERATVENERQRERENERGREKVVAADRFRVAWPAARYQTSGTRNGQSGWNPLALPPTAPPSRPPRRRSNFAVKFERMPCKSQNRGQFRGNVNKYRCTFVSRATIPGYGLVVRVSPRAIALLRSVALSPSAPLLLRRYPPPPAAGN